MSTTQSCPPKPSAAGVYRSLEDGRSIRILSILPGNGADPLHCTLHHAQLDDPPQYETISYHWGDVRCTESALLDGVTVCLTASSAAFLRRVRLPDLARSVWIDAICINQDDVDERNSQVQLMHDVYAKGKQNLIYLGEADMTEAFRNVKDICAETQAAGASPLLDMVNGKVAISRQGSVPLPTYNTEALIELFSSEWFWRVWTWQEAVLSPCSMCYCGTAETTLLDIVRAAGALAYNTSFIDKALSNLCEAALPISWYIDPTFTSASQDRRLVKFGENVYVTHGRRCSLPVDRIYSILGLFPQLNISPDYRKPMEEVFQDTVRAAVANDHSLSLIKRANRLSLRSYSSLLGLDSTMRPWYFEMMAQEDESFEMPSWVPSWYRQSTRMEGVLSVIAGSLSYDACKGRTYEPATDDLEPQCEPGILRVFGIIIGHVSRRAAIPPDPIPGRNYGWCLEDMEDLAIESISLRREGSLNNTADKCPEIAEQELATVLSHGRLIDDAVDPSKDLAGYRIYKRICQAERAADIPRKIAMDEQILRYLVRHSEGISETEWAQAGDFEYNLIRTMGYRRLFTTNKGRLGVGPDSIEKDDLVVVLNGLECPAILRRSGEHYLFIGIAYVHGIMFGEAVEEHERGGNADQMFELC